jgi:predicted RNA-binding protein YlqC (UPF0109 family)
MDAAESSIADLVQSIVVALVDEPEAVEVECTEDGDTLRVDIKVAEDDTGKVIGRQGRIIKAIRVLARALSAYHGSRHVEVEVLG